MGQRRRFAPRALPCARRTRCTSSRACTKVLRHRNGPPVGLAALQGRHPDLARLEVDVARAQAKRFADVASGHREGPDEGLDGGLGVRARRGEEALALRLRQVLSPARVDELAHHRPSPIRPSDPERCICTPIGHCLIPTSFGLVTDNRRRTGQAVHLMAVARSEVRALVNSHAPFPVHASAR